MGMAVALGKQRQAEICRFQAWLTIIVNFRTARNTQRDPISEK